MTNSTTPNIPNQPSSPHPTAGSVGASMPRIPRHETAHTSATHRRYLEAQKQTQLARDSLDDTQRSSSAAKQRYEAARRQRLRNIQRRGWRTLLGTVATLALVGVGIWAVASALVWLTRDGGDFTPASAVQADSEPQTPPLSFQGFDPGLIISDEDLHNSASMTQHDIDAFIQQWNAGCVPGADGTPCLKDWRGDAPSFPEDDSCWALEGGKNLSAAEVIYRVAQACEFNPQAILVILQKEQGLITASGANLQPYRYRSAMGYACPDDAPCDPEFEGFARQVYYGARQFQKYRIYPEKYTFQAGQTQNIPYHAHKQCGVGEVFIRNQATASLYNYTPHQPNSDALAGRSTECASWGNLHFYAYWNAWFAQ